MGSVNNSYLYGNPLQFETRKVIEKDFSLLLVLPKRFTEYLGILKGDLLKITLLKSQDSKGNLLISKVDLEGF